MTPERWRKIDELFGAAIRLEPHEREPWLDHACGPDRALRAEVDRLLANDEQADDDGFLVPPEGVINRSDVTASWTTTRHDLPDVHGRGLAPSDPPRSEDTGGFTPKAVIQPGEGRKVGEESTSLIRARVRELPVIYMLICGMTICWRHLMLKIADVTISAYNAAAMLALGVIAALLWSRRSLSLGRLKALEFATVAVLATMVACTQYHVMLQSSELGNTLKAQRVMKNSVLLTSILILTYGIYVPKNWRRTAAVTIPLALLPFATLLSLGVGHSAAMSWLRKGNADDGTMPLALFSYDAMLLLILALCSTYGAHTISRLRRQVVEARQLGQYRLRRRIGVGGMGEVYLAEHELLKRPCAIKLIRPSNVSDPKTLERFEREVRITATLSHWNTVEIFDYGRTEDGTYYYVMEYLPGLSLEELVKRHGPLPPGRVVYLLRQVCLALREAHGAGLIHRDVKPSNIFAARRGGMDDVAKLLDFGLVRPATTIREPGLSREGQILGTPLFMSPEQAMGTRTLDERSDIYSLGAVAYFLLTGRAPFDEESGIGVMIAHARDPVVPPSSVVPDIPEDLERVVMKCLAKRPDDRYQDAECLGHDLGDCACSHDWDQSRAARWWSSGDHPSVATPETRPV